jgi:cysteine desulfurase
MIYLDNAATTKCFESSAEIFREYSVNDYFNPSALYKQAAESSVRIKNARENIKKALGAGDGGELYFVSGGTEADNTALFCTRKKKGSRIIVSDAEHDAVINCANELKAQGYDVVFAPILSDGSVDCKKFQTLLNDNVSLVSIMHVSNETGAINDIRHLCKLTKQYSPQALFHSDGVQAFCKIETNLRSLGVDLYSVSGHKLHAPKGIGALYIKKGAAVRPLLYGGGQEKGMRSGTENEPMILAFEDAVNKNMEQFAQNCAKKRKYIEYFKQQLSLKTQNTVIISPEDAAPNILTAAFEGIRGEVLLHALENHGILVGIGSACSSHKESRFKKLLGLDGAHRDGIVRFSISQFNEIDEVNYVVSAVAEELARFGSYNRV